jgi:hypothetical protein
MVSRPPPQDDQPWRRADTYDYTDALPRRAWGWEFLRRDPSYQREWAVIRPAVSVEQRRHLSLLKANRPLDDLAPWGVFFRGSARSRCDWRHGVLAARSMPSRPAGDGRSSRLIGPILARDAPPPHGAADPAGRLPASLGARSRRSLQLAVQGLSLLEPVSLRTNAVFDSRPLRARLAALECLNALISTQRFPDHLFPVDPKSRRLRHVLQALDGSLAGATYRDIAVALLGEARVLADWSDAGRHLFDQVRRAVQRGRYLMNGGYRSFLL